MQSRRIISIVVIAFILSVQHSHAQNDKEKRPEAWALIGASRGGYINEKILEVQKGIGGMQQVSQLHAERIKVDSFSVRITRNDNSLYNFRNMGAYFEKSVHDMFEKLQIGDKVLFFDIYATDLNKKIILLSPIECMIK